MNKKRASLLLTGIDVTVGIGLALKDQCLAIGILAVAAVEPMGEVDGVALLNSAIGNFRANEARNQPGVLGKTELGARIHGYRHCSGDERES